MQSSLRAAGGRPSRSSARRLARVAYSRSPATSRASALSLNSSAWTPFPPRMPFRARRVAGLICNGGYSSRCVSPHAAHVNGESMIRMSVPTG